MSESNFTELVWPTEHVIFVEKVLAANYGACQSTQNTVNLMYGVDLLRLNEHWARLPERKKPRNATIRVYHEIHPNSNDFEPSDGWLEIRFTREVYVQKHNLNLPEVSDLFDGSISSTSRLICCKLFNDPRELITVNNAYQDIIESEAERWFALDIAFYFERLG